MYDIGSLALQSVLPTAVVTASANGAAIDLKNYIGITALILDSSAGTGTTPTLDNKIQDSDDGITFADIVPPVAFAQVTSGGASQQRIALNADGARRYVRLVSTVAGTTPSFTYSVNLLGRKQVIP